MMWLFIPVVAAPLVFALMSGGGKKPKRKENPRPNPPNPPAPPNPEPTTETDKLKRVLAATWTWQYTIPRGQWLHTALLAIGRTPAGQGSDPQDIQWAEQISTSFNVIVAWRDWNIYDGVLLREPADVGRVASALGLAPIGYVSGDTDYTTNAWRAALKNIQEEGKVYLGKVVAVDGILGPRTAACLSTLWLVAGRKGRAP